MKSLESFAAGTITQKQSSQITGGDDYGYTDRSYWVWEPGKGPVLVKVVEPD